MAPRRLSNNKKKMVAALVNQANQALTAEHFDVMATLCSRIEAIQPDHPDAIHIRAILCMQESQLEKAEKLFLAAIEGAPKRALFHASLGALYLMQELYTKALPYYEKAMEMGSHLPSTQFGYGLTLIETERYEDAYSVLIKAKKRVPHDADLLMALYRACNRMEQIDEALEYLNAILRIDPTHAEANLELGLMTTEAGRVEEAKAIWRANLSTNPDHIATHVSLAVTSTHASQDDPEVKAIVSLYARSASDSEERKKLANALGKIMGELGDYDAAFSYFRENNDIALRKNPYSNRREQPYLQSVIKAFTSEVISRTSNLHDATPIFIVGMPRCGSTLVEQILASHPDTANRGECGFFDDALHHFHSQQQPLTVERTSTFTPEQWRALGEVYLEKLKADDSAALRITDKSLRNISQIGAIHCALPKARVVHVRRHPLDTCLSIYKTDLQSAAFDYGRDLGELGLYYRMYLKLMQHWRDVLPADAMYELDYEELTANQEEETRRLLDACGLEWDERCLRFEKADNRVRTASVAQVRREMYKDSVAAWKHYEEHLQPLIRILGTDYNHPPIRKP